MLTSGVVIWVNKKKTLVVLSNTKFEYMALFKVLVEAIWIHKLLYELKFPQIAPTTIYFDNQSVIFALTKNPKFNSRNKHIDIQYHFTCDQILI
jgi:hypothetical protein